MIPRRSILLAVVVALLQIGFLGWMIAGRAAILRNGHAVLLKVQPVDPRDLLRGDYVWLRYQISSIPAKMVTNFPPGNEVTVADGPIFVRIGRDPDGYWRTRSATLGALAPAPAPGELDIRGTVATAKMIDASSSLSVSYGIERYYVPEGEGMAIQNNMNVRSFGMLVALAGDGTPQIKALMDGDVKVYEEPPY